MSQSLTVPSSEPEYIHLLSFWKPTCMVKCHQPNTSLAATCSELPLPAIAAFNVSAVSAVPL